jgi:lipoyl(octanoyl) transferase
VDFEVRDLGRVPYRQAWDIQLDAHDQVRSGAPNQLLFVEHDPVLTLGMGFHPENLLLPRGEYEGRGIEIVPTDRGGDVTFHGPGQLVIYPIFDLSAHRDLHAWLRALESVVMSALLGFGIEGRRFPPHTGVWVGDRKIAAIGIKVKRWINLHGIALNCSNALEIYDLFVPCGIQEYGVTSIEKETGRSDSISEAKAAITSSFEALSLESAP